MTTSRHGLFRVICFTSLALGAVTVVCSNDAPPQDNLENELAVLIQQLGDDDFATREGATDRLVKIGLSATAALEKGSHHPDREIRFRCQRILIIVDELDFQRRLDAFADSQDDDKDYGLSGWNKFREFVDDGVEARKLFVEMQKAESDTLHALDKGPQAVTDALNTRAQHIQAAMQNYRFQPTVGNVAALIFMAADDEVKLTQQTGMSLYRFAFQQNFRNAITAGARKELLRKVVGPWIRRAEDWNAYQGVVLAMQYNIKEGLEPAKSLLKNNTNPAHYRQYAVLATARFGDKSFYPLLEGLFEDKTRTGSQRLNGKMYETQLRDVALAAIIEIAGQDHKKYGFSRIQRNTQMVFNTSTLGFENEKSRQRAFEQWKNFRKMSNTPKAQDGDSEKGS